MKGQSSMKANKLQVGSWVLLQGKPYQIDILNGYQESDLGFEPIPITPELLEKNGFEIKNASECGRDFVMSRNTIVSGGKENIVDMHNHGGYIHTNEKWNVGISRIIDPDILSPLGFPIESPIASCELTYLHQLQALLQICKIEHEWQV